MLTRFLVLFFMILIIYQLLIAVFGMSIVEGMDTAAPQYIPYSSTSTDPATLAKQNAQNIDFLKAQFDSVLKLQTEVTDLSSNMQILNQQVTALTQQQQSYATQITGADKPPPTITGLDSA